jgi:alkaline phosphatase D
VIIRTLLGLVVALLVPSSVAQAAGPLNVMLGLADKTSITLWVQAAGPGRVSAEFHPDGAPERARRVERTTAEDSDFAVHLRLANLEPGTRYRYRLSVDGEASGEEGAFRTQPLWEWRTDPPEVTVAFGSCNYLGDGRFDRPGNPFGDGHGIFESILAKQPDLMLWLGDNLYLREPEWTSLEAMSTRYRFHRAAPELRRFWRGTQHVATWDDHDYGPNDADGSFVMKGASLEAFRRYWPNPTHGVPGVPGVFTQFTLADADFFVLDGRYHRYPNQYPKVPEKALLGPHQLEWLKQALLSSRATFKVVAMGTQFWNRVSRFETWSNYPHEQQQLADWLQQQGIRGVLFLSGDRHFAQMLRVERPGTYPLWEVTSSPLTAGVATNPGDNERNNPDLVPGSIVTQRNFGLLRIAGPKAARTIAFELYDTDGRLLVRQEVKAADLR